MTVLLWVLQVVLAIAFIVSGTTKLTRPKVQLQPRMGYVEDFSARAVKGIGAAEVLGALGLVLPAATKVAPVLTPVAATGLAVLMAGAIVVHKRRDESAAVIAPSILLVLSAFVAWGRFGPYSL